MQEGGCDRNYGHPPRAYRVAYGCRHVAICRMFGGGLPGTLKPKRQCSPGTRRPHTESLPPILVFDTYHSLLVLPTRTPSSHFPYRSVVNPWLIRLLSSSLLLLPSFLLPQTWRGRSYLISRHSGIAPPKLTLPRGIRVSQRACDPLDQGTISKFP